MMYNAVTNDFVNIADADADEDHDKDNDWCSGAGCTWVGGNSMQNFASKIKISLLHLHCFCFCTAFLVLHRIYTKPALRHICTTFALRLHCTVITLPTSLLCTAPHCSYILFNVRFRTDSSSVQK